MTSDDASAGWDAVAERFAALRSEVGTDIVLHWSRQLPRGGAVLDIGCGTGVPIGTCLAAQGFTLFGIDPAPKMIAAFRANVPEATAACEPAETSRFFDRRFDGVVAIGLLFLLPEAAQAAVIAQVGRALHPGGRFLFSAPRERCDWEDSLTGRRSWSLGEAGYGALLGRAGLEMVGCRRDAGGNDYFEAAAGEA
ncbi:class I SAM-dependent methyltransferase [Sphingomonas sp. ABOLE]|uniref:class I SAM-dependent methyltransferase n=1 Tax=Sphingomonas sp. ABOLE TaxID=1985878 RepID=UPI001F49F700|nr:class I SAM-dependent methyltransferase [Sphingomonas sp. ABOLE]